MTRPSCLSCGTDDLPADAKFCPQCGASQTLTCMRCGAELPAAARFCISCGAPVGHVVEGEPRSPGTLHPEPVQASAPSTSNDESSAGGTTADLATGQGEHRQITAVFCDIVGSTRLAQALGAEVMQEKVQRFRVLCADAVGRFDGRRFRSRSDCPLKWTLHENRWD